MSYQSIFRPDLFAGQTIIVTGGGSGIGRCTAHELAALGATVAIVGRDVAKLERVRDEILGDGGKVSIHACDIRDETQVGETIDAVLDAHDRLDGLVNNAGGQWMAPMKTISTNGFEAVVRNNLTGGFIFMREAYTRWMEQHGGAIVNIIADIWNGWPNFAHSAAARGGMFTLTESAACEWAEAGVAGQHGGAERDRFQRLRPLFARSAPGAAQVRREGAAQALRHRIRGVRRDRLPTVAGCGLHHRQLPPRRWRHAQRAPDLAARR